MAKKYFGTDGVRGEVGQFPITPDFVLKLGYAAGQVLVQHDDEHRPTVLIGKDTRISGYMLEAALVAGFTAAGVNVIQTGPLPTPGVAYLTRALRLAAGVMISASHNVYSDNGIKFFAEGGVKLSDAIELEIEAKLAEEMQTQPSSHLGRARRINGADDRYIEFCKSTFPGHLDLRGLKLVVDTANGAGYHVAPKVFHELGAHVVAIGAEPNGYNINEKVGATHPKALQAAVLQNEADYGIALDGDGDRLMMVDKHGKVYDGDSLIYVIAKARAKEGVAIGGVVGTVMTNMAMELALQEQGVAFCRAKVGDRYVLENMLKNGYKIGGEQSGHIIFLEHNTTGDGLVTALQLLAVLKRTGRTLTDLAGIMKKYPQVLVNVHSDNKAGLDDCQPIWDAVAAAEKELDGRGRILVRPSGTEPLVRVMAEAETHELTQRVVDDIVEVVKRELP